MPLTLVAALAMLASPGAGTQENRPPEFTNPTDSWSCRVGSTCTLDVAVRDADGDPLSVTTSALPSGATFVRTDHSSPSTTSDHASIRTFALTWKPTADQSGEFPLAFTASDGQATVSQSVTLEVSEEWEVYALPGVQAVSYWPRQSIDTGGYQGASVECLGIAWAHRNNKHGPSHGRVYLDLDLLFPTSGHGGNLYAYTIGTDLTVERNPSRRFLLPYFGAEVGGIHSAALGDYFVAIPYAGLHLWADRSAWVNVSGGYVLPGRNLDRLSGAFAKAGLDLSFW